MRHQKDSRKFMQVLDERFFKFLGKVAKSKGITTQELIRAVIVPDWVQTYKWRQTVMKPQAQRDLLQIRRRRRRKR